jgi:hypothetical protein
MISEKNLAILACPACKGGLLQAANGSDLLCLPCDVNYPVRNGIPVMLPDEAIIIQGQGSRGKVC